MHRTAAWPLLLALLAGAAHAQLGADEQACRDVWGIPASTLSRTNGTRVLTFAASGTSIEVGLVSGVVRRVVYRKPSIAPPEVERLLALNGEGREWHAWMAPGLNESAGNLWTRTDEASASLDASGLTIAAPEWLLSASLPRPAAGPDSPGVAATTNGAPAEAGESSHAAHVAFAGTWQCGGPVKPFTVLQAKTDGALTWLEFGEAERREIRLRWRRELDGTFAVAPASGMQGRTAETGQSIGVLEVLGAGAARFTPGARAGQAGLHATPGKPLHFNRLAAMPRWKPRAPALLPVNGDAREDVVGLLGKPTGTMRSGGRDVLVYPWGNVWLRDGRVDGVE